MSKLISHLVSLVTINVGCTLMVTLYDLHFRLNGPLSKLPPQFISAMAIFIIAYGTWKVGVLELLGVKRRRD